MKRKILIILFLSLELYLLFNAKEVIFSFNNTLKIIINNLMPTMFFSILFTNILIKLDFHEYIPKFIIKFFSYIFNISDKEVIIFIFSLISGYPNNSKMLINNINLNNIILYTNFINPIFFLGTVSSIYLKDIKLSFIIYLSHILSNIVIGILVKNKNKLCNQKKYISYYNNVYFNSLKNTIISLSNIFSNILFFSILISLINNIFYNNFINAIITGIIEFSSGVYLISKLNITKFMKGLIILCIINFGSFSIHMQIISLNEKIKYTRYFIFRIINIVIGILIYIILNNLLSY